MNLRLERYVRSRPREGSLLNAAHEVLLKGHVPQVGHVVVGGEVDESRLGEDLEPLLQRLASVLLRVVVGTVGLVTLVAVFARIQLIVLRVVFLFFPAVAEGTVILIGTALSVVVDVGPGSPVGALLLRVVVELRFPPEVLLVVRVDALIALMVSFVVWTPHCLEVEHVEV